MRKACRVAVALTAVSPLLVPITSSVQAGRAAPPPRQMERLDRGVVAVRQADGSVLVGWRLLGTEAPNMGFNVYRVTGSGKPVRLNPQPLLEATDWADRAADPAQVQRYFVRGVVNGKEQAALGDGFTSTLR